MRRVTLGLVLGALASCHQPQLDTDAAALEVPAVVDFGQAFLNHPRTRVLHLANRSRAPLDLSVSFNSPFKAPKSLSLGADSSATLTLSFAPYQRGAVDSTLFLRAGKNVWTVELKGSADDAPVCGQSECHQTHLDAEKGCVVDVLPDDTACGSEATCIENGVCKSGVCRGQPVDCDDGNACTFDSCAPGAGCQHSTVTCATPRDSCQASKCDSQNGCGLSQAPDGTPCGLNDCAQAHVCIGGTCSVRAAPEGSLCGVVTSANLDGDACHGPSVCHAQQCVRPAPQAKPPKWQFVPASDRYVMATTVDLAGNAYFFVGTAYNYLDAGMNYPIELESFDRDGALRWVVDLTAEHSELQNGRVLTIDSDRRVLYLGARTYMPGYPTGAADHLVLAQARDADTGAKLWEHDLATGITPQNPGPDGEMGLDILRAALLDNGQVAFELLEGFEYHQSYTVALDSSGNEAWRVHRSGHIGSAGSFGTEYWETSAACWSSDVTAVRVQGGATMADVDSAQSEFVAFDSQGVIATHWDQSGNYQLTQVGSFTGPGLVANLINLPPDAGVTWIAEARLAEGHFTFPTTSYYSTTGLTRLERNTFAEEWSVAVPDAGYLSELELLEDGGSLLAVGNTEDGGTDLLVYDANGQLVDRCPYGPFQFEVAVHGRRYGTANYSGFVVYDAPGDEVAPDGWATNAGHVGNTWRPR